MVGAATLAAGPGPSGDGPGRDGEDRRHLSAERQFGDRRQLFQDGLRGRRRRRQQWQRRSRQAHSAGQGRWPAGLKNAKIQLIFADNQGTPAAGQNQALRLITEEKVAALIGAYQSGVTLTASAIAERHGIPFVNGESVAANLTERGFKWFFRVTPVAIDFARAYSAFLKEQKAAGRKTENIALVHENTEYGNSVGSVIVDQFAKDGFKVGLKIPYSANSSDVQPQVLQLKEKNPDVLIFISYTSDAILYTKTMKE
jgi:branched-chain amino acid transport system substrate-binding protein